MITVYLPSSREGGAIAIKVYQVTESRVVSANDVDGQTRGLCYVYTLDKDVFERKEDAIAKAIAQEQDSVKRYKEWMKDAESRIKRMKDADVSSVR